MARPRLQPLAAHYARAGYDIATTDHWGLTGIASDGTADSSWVRSIG